MPERRIRTPRETFDDPWKQIVTALFEQFVAFFAADLWTEIDWQRPPEFLDKELRRVAKGLGRRRVTADFLARVWLKDGGDLWLLAHIELQAQRDDTLPERMFRYNFRAYDLHSRPVFSLAILADGDASWRPDRFGYEVSRTRVGISYPVVKLLDYSERQQELQGSDNPFALAVLAHLKTLETRGDAQARLNWKVRLVRLLYARQWQRREIEELFQFLDWIMSLPEELEDRFETEWQHIERETTMTQTMPPILRRAQERGERVGEQRGIEIGEQRAKRETLMRLLEQRFGAIPAEIRARMEAITEIGRLNGLIDSVLTVDSLEDLPLLREP